MESNRQNKLFQQKMQELTELPDGFSFEATETWNKLETKLTGKKPNNKIAWWMMTAAASVVVIVSFLFLKQQPKQIETVQQIVAPLITEPIVSVKQQAKSLATNPSSKQTQILTVKPIAVKKQIIKNRTAILVIELKEPIVAVQETQPQTETVKPEETIVSVPILPVAITQPKRKIIHINELYQEYQLEQQRVAEAKRNQKPAEEEINTEKNTEPSKPWYKKNKQNTPLKNQ